MDRDALIIQLLQERLIAIDAVRRDAATILLELCRTEWSKDRFASIVNRAADRHRPDLAREIRQLASFCGIARRPSASDASPKQPATE